jgi:hypothetical protein
VAGAYFDGVVPVASVVGQKVGASEPGWIALVCVDEAVVDALVEEVHAGIDVVREFFLDTDAPVESVGLGEGAVVDCEDCRQWRCDGCRPAGGVVGVVANAGEGPGEVFELGVLVVEADAGGDLERRFGSGRRIDEGDAR